MALAGSDAFTRLIALPAQTASERPIGVPRGGHPRPVLRPGRRLAERRNDAGRPKHAMGTEIGSHPRVRDPDNPITGACPDERPKAQERRGDWTRAMFPCFRGRFRHNGITAFSGRFRALGAVLNGCFTDGVNGGLFGRKTWERSPRLRGVGREARVWPAGQFARCDRTVLGFKCRPSGDSQSVTPVAGAFPADGSLRPPEIGSTERTIG